jgi:lysozyme
MASTRTKVGSLVGAIALAAAIAVGPVVRHFEPAPATAAGLSVAYRDSNSSSHPLTICDGHTGSDVHLGDTATPAQCEAFSLQDRIRAAQTVIRCLPHLTNPDHTGALTDAVYNLGPAVVCGSSTLRRHALAGDYFSMCTQLTDATDADGWPDGWTKGNGKRLKGLVIRRIYDRDWCLGHQHQAFP